MWLFNYIIYKMTLIKFLHKAYLIVSARTKFHKAAAWIFGTQTNTMNTVIQMWQYQFRTLEHTEVSKIMTSLLHRMWRSWCAITSTYISAEHALKLLPKWFKARKIPCLPGSKFKVSLKKVKEKVQLIF